MATAVRKKAIHRARGFMALLIGGVFIGVILIGGLALGLIRVVYQAIAR